VLSLNAWSSSTGDVRRVENGDVSRTMWPARVGGRLVAVVQERGSRLAWGLSEDQREMRGAVWSGGQRGGVETEVVCPAAGQSEVVGRGVGRTPEAGRWGWEVLWVCVPTW
jgi:hypothetical protein